MLLEALLENNPYTGELSLEPYEKGAQEVAAWLDANPLPIPDEVKAAMAAEEQEGEEDNDDNGADAEESDKENDKESSEGEEEEEGNENSEGEEGIIKPEPEPAEGEGDTKEETPLELERKTKLKMFDFFVSAASFIRQLEAAVPTLCGLLGSRVVSDVQAALRFFVKAFAFQLPGADTGVRRMLALVWSREAQVRDELLTTFHHLFITVPGSDGKQFLRPIEIAYNLVELVDHGTVASLTSLEEILKMLTTKGMLPDNGLNALW